MRAGPGGVPRLAGGDRGRRLHAKKKTGDGAAVPQRPVFHSAPAFSDFSVIINDKARMIQPLFLTKLTRYGMMMARPAPVRFNSRDFEGPGAPHQCSLHEAAAAPPHLTRAERGTLAGRYSHLPTT